MSYFQHHVLSPAAVAAAGFVGVEDSEDGQGGGVVGLDGLCGKVGEGREGGMRDRRKCPRAIEKEEVKAVTIEPCPPLHVPGRDPAN